MRRGIILGCLLLWFQSSWSQNYLYHGKNRLVIDKPLSTYNNGDTLKSFDSLRNMSLQGVFLTVKFVKNLVLHYESDTGIRSIDVAAVIRDSNLLWNGKCVELDRNSRHSTITFFDYDKFRGISTYYVRDQIQSVSSRDKSRSSTLGFNVETGKPNYYWLQDSTGVENGTSINFHKNGEIESLRRYTHGVKVGMWHYYDENGILIRTDEYKNGVLVRSRKPGKQR